MLLASIIIVFSLLALGLLALLDRGEALMAKFAARPRPTQLYYDAFSDRRQTARVQPCDISNGAAL